MKQRTYISPSAFRFKPRPSRISDRGRILSQIPLLPYSVLLLTSAIALCSSAPASRGPNQRPGPDETAVAQFRKLRTELRADRERVNWQSYLQNARELSAFLNGSPGSLIEIARAHAHLGEQSQAIDDLRKFVRMGQSTQLLETLPDFVETRRDAGFKAISEEMAANQTRLSSASTAFTMSDSQLLAEDIDYDGKSKRFFVSSILKKKIVSLDSSGRATDFARAPDGWPVLAIKVDSRRGFLWATEVALDGFSVVPKADWGRSAVLCYDLHDGKLLRRIEGPAHSALGDMVLTKDGDPVISDGAGGGIYRLKSGRNELDRIDKGDFISPQTPALHPDGRHLFIPDYARGIGLLDVSSGKVNWIRMEGKYALDGIDGLYFLRGSLIAVQNGTSPERVIEFKLDGSLSKIASEKVIERATRTLGDPTHGVVVDGIFYYIANSGWSEVNDKGELKSGASFTPALIMRYAASPL